MGLDPDEITVVEYPLQICPVTLTDVLDLRVPSAAEWLVNFCASHEAEVARVLKVKKPVSPTAYFAVLLHFLLDQDTGGQLPLLQGIGAWLRSNGVAGLVFPSARCDSGVAVEGDQVKSWWGFNYVDYRNSSPVNWEDHFGRTLGAQDMEGVEFRVAPDRRRWGSWTVDGILRWQILRYVDQKQEFEGKKGEAFSRLCDGSIYPSDPLPALFGPDNLWYSIAFPAVGHYIAHYISGQEVLGDSAEFTYDGQAWFLIRETPGGESQLLCPRCARVLVINDAKTAQPVSSCPSCGLGDREAGATWEPGEDWQGIPSLG